MHEISPLRYHARLFHLRPDPLSEARSARAVAAAKAVLAELREAAGRSALDDDGVHRAEVGDLAQAVG